MAPCQHPGIPRPATPRCTDLFQYHALQFQILLDRWFIRSISNPSCTFSRIMVYFLTLATSCGNNLRLVYRRALVPQIAGTRDFHTHLYLVSHFYFLSVLRIYILSTYLSNLQCFGSVVYLQTSCISFTISFIFRYNSILLCVIFQPPQFLHTSRYYFTSNPHPC